MTDTRPITIFVNPVAGRGKCKKKYPLAAQALQQAGFECDILVSQYPGHITRASSDLAARGQRTVVACGGDGTVNELVNGIAGTDTAMGIIPLGRANNYASTLGITNDIEQACQIISDGYQTKTDLIRVNGDKLLTGNGFVALETEVGALTRAQRNDKSILQSIGSIGNLLKFYSFQPKKVELRLDGDRFFGEVLLVTFKNAPNAAPSSSISPSQEGTPRAEPALEVCIVDSRPRWNRPSRISSIRKKIDSTQGGGVSYYRTSAVHVQSLGPLGFYSNDDLVTATPFRLELMPNHLNVILPRK